MFRTRETKIALQLHSFPTFRPFSLQLLQRNVVNEYVYLEMDCCKHIYKSNNGTYYEIYFF